MADRRLLLAASVLGRRFHVDDLVAIGADIQTVRDRIGRLVEREMLSTEADVTDPAVGELAFVQDVVREVAYRTLSRGERRTLHLAAAESLEAANDPDSTESLASHFAEAHDLAPDHPDASRIARRAVAALRRAAAQALARHVPLRALGLLEHALRLTDLPDQRAVVLEEVATAASAAGRLELAERHLRELVELRTAAGRRRDAARARARLASVLLTAQRNEPAVTELELALRAVRDIGRDPSGVELAAQLARARLLIGDDRGALEWTKRALAGAGRHDLPAVAADLLVTRGTARFGIGDEEGGREDLRAAIADAQRIGSLPTELRARNNLAWLTIADDPRATLETARQAVDLATTKGGGDLVAQLADVACSAAIDTGDWDWALVTVEEMQHDGTPLANRIGLAASADVIHALRGAKGPLPTLASLDPLPNDLDEQIRAGIAMTEAWAAFLAGDGNKASIGAREAADGSLGVERFLALVLAARASLWLADAGAARATLGDIDGMAIPGRAADAHRRTLRAGIAALDDGSSTADAYAGAAAAWRDLDLPGMLAICLADQARMTRSSLSPEAVALFDELGAGGLHRLSRSEISATGDRVPPARSRQPRGGTARPTGGARRSPPARGRRSPAG
jgi:tetratricopeptide (TPR) repeat protein